MTTNLLGATVEIASSKETMRGVIRGVEIHQYDGLKIIVEREDGALRVFEATGVGSPTVRVVAEPPTP